MLQLVECRTETLVTVDRTTYGENTYPEIARLLEWIGEEELWMRRRAEHVRKFNVIADIHAKRLCVEYGPAYVTHIIPFLVPFIGLLCYPIPQKATLRIGFDVEIIFGYGVTDGVPQFRIHLEEEQCIA